RLHDQGRRAPAAADSRRRDRFTGPYIVSGDREDGRGFGSGEGVSQALSTSCHGRIGAPAAASFEGSIAQYLGRGAPSARPSSVIGFSRASTPRIAAASRAMASHVAVPAFTQ